MEESKKFFTLLQSYLDEVLPEKEYYELMEYVRSGVYDKYLMQEIQRRSIDTDTDVRLSAVRAEMLLQKILNSERYTAQLVPEALKRKRLWKPIFSSAAIILGILLAGWWFFQNKTGNHTTELKENNIALQQTKEGKKIIQLPDGSTVLLNKKSKLEYPDNFNSAKREVTLIGEGYFDIMHDSLRPFIVHTGSITTTVLGTAFNVRAYANQQIVITVTRGKVKVSRANKTLAILVPDRQLTVDTKNLIEKEMAVNAQRVTEWKDDFLILNDASLEEAAILIGNKYHVTISLENEHLRNCRITSTFLKDDTLEHILNVICGVVNASYTKQPDGQIIISGAGCE